VRTAGLILGAGAGSRFRGEKLAADLDGRPLLAHVVGALAAVPLDELLVVLRPGASAALRAVVSGPIVRVVDNPDADGGLSTSLRLGIATLAAAPEPPDLVVVALGDQPRVRAAVVRELLAAAATPGARPFTVPAYAAGGGRNPVVLARVAFGLAGDTTGDAGLGPLLAAHPELVTVVPVTGGNPDVDTPAELARLAAEGPAGRS